MLCVRYVVCVVVVCVVGGTCVCLSVLRHAEKTWKKPVCGFKKTSVCAFKTSPCVRSKRPRVYRHTRAHVFQHVRVVPVHRARFERTHGGQGVIVSSAYQNLPTYGYHVIQRFTKETSGSSPFSV